MSIALVMVRDDGKSQEVTLARPSYIAGRATDCALRLPGGALSRHHCEFSIEDGILHVRDLGSSNGTYVNRERIAEKTALGPGDLVCLGECVFVVRVGGKPDFIDAEESYDDGLVLPPPPAGAAPAPTTAPNPASKPTPTPKAMPAAPKAPAPTNAPATPKPQTAGKPKPLTDADGSSVGDFDFFDDDDLKGQPKL